MKAVAVAIALSSLAGALWPMPRTLSTGSQYVKLSPAFGIHVDIQNPPQDLLEAVDRTTSYLWNDKLGRLIVGRGSNDTSALVHAPSLSALTLSLLKGMSASPIAQEAVLPLEDRSESYSLKVPADGSCATLTANSTLGLLRGLTTFTQLWYHVAGTVYTYEAPIEIPIDYPAYVSFPSPRGNTRRAYGV
jgi:hexosaminidase